MRMYIIFLVAQLFSALAVCQLNCTPVGDNVAIPQGLIAPKVMLVSMVSS